MKLSENIVIKKHSQLHGTKNALFKIQKEKNKLSAKTSFGCITQQAKL